MAQLTEHPRAGKMAGRWVDPKAGLMVGRMVQQMETPMVGSKALQSVDTKAGQMGADLVGQTAQMKGECSVHRMVATMAVLMADQTEISMAGWMGRLMGGQ